MPVPTTEAVASAVSRQFGMRTETITRQTRWRPTWFVTGTVDGVEQGLVVRGERVDTQVFPLRHEVRFHEIVESHGIAVPKVLGWLDDIGWDAVVLDLVPGRPDFRDTAEADRDVIVEEYLNLLVAVHALDPDEFSRAGITRATAPTESATVGHWHMERLWRAKKTQPDPFLEFCLGWLHRNPPRSQGRETPILWDTGQFHHRDGHLVAALDLEFGHVGDPMLDLAVWRMRDTLIPYGDFGQLYRRYAELSGRAVDIEAIKRHHFAATIGNQLMFGPAVADPVPETDLMNNMQWNSETNLHATEALAEFLGVELPEVEVPEAKRTRAAKTYDHLIESLKVSTDDYLLAHDLRLAFRMARHLKRVSEIGDAVAEADLDDLAPLLGYRPETWWEGDAALEKFVLADAGTGRYDEELVALFHRRNLRVHMQLGPAGSSMVAHYPTQPFGTA